MDDIKRIYALLLHGTGLKIREISKEFGLDKYYVAELLFSSQNHLYWYQDDDGLWFAKEGAIQIDEPQEDKLIAPLKTPKRFNIKRYLQKGSSPSLRLYLKELTRYRIYSNEEIFELCKRYKNGDKQSFELLVKSQQRLIVGIAFIYCKDGVQLEDLIQEGNIGLIKAIESFDYARYGSFINYAKFWIIQAISYSMTYLPYLIKLPNSQLIQYRKVCKYKEKYEQLNGFPPPLYDINLDEEIDFERLKYLNQLPDNLKDIISIEELDEYESDCPPPDSFQQKEYNYFIINKLLKCLTLREMNVIQAFFGLGSEKGEMSFEAIGKRFDLTRERIRQIYEKAMRRLRDTAKIMMRIIMSEPVTVFAATGYRNAISDAKMMDVKRGIDKSTNTFIKEPGILLNQRELLVLNLIKNNKHITVTEIMGKTSLSIGLTYKVISDLRKKRVIERIGRFRVGYWNVLDDLKIQDQTKRLSVNNKTKESVESAQRTTRYRQKRIKTLNIYDKMVINLIKENGYWDIYDIIKKTSLSYNRVDKIISKLLANKYIRREGTPKNNYWVLTDKASKYLVDK